MSWRRFFKRRWWDTERAREIDSYIEIETADNMDRGMCYDDALAAARRRFGNPLHIREDIYRMNTIGWIESIAQDLRYGARQLRRSPGFAMVAIVSLALGIGANTAIFQLLDAVRLRSLPVQNPEELAEVRIIGGNGGMGINNGRYSHLTRPLWNEIRANQKAFSGIFAWSTGRVRVGPPSDQRVVDSITVSGDFFRVLGVQPWRGRLFRAEDEAATCPQNLAVVSYAYWQGAMGGRELRADTTLLIDGNLHEVIGVTRPEFFGLAVGDRFNIALPYCEPKEALPRNYFDLSVVGRLKPEWTIERASAHLTAISPGLFEATALRGYNAATIERYKRFKLAAYPVAEGVSWLRSTYDSSLNLLFAITGLVLLIACANLANLMLARASAREREIAVRLALGASRSRLVRQLLAESAMLALAGASVGVVVAHELSLVLVRSLSVEGSIVTLSVPTDWRVLSFGAAAAAATCLLFGVMPALRATRTEPASSMKTGGRGNTATREHFSVQRLMVVAQIAISLVLLVGALLFVGSFRNLMMFDPGMRQGGIIRSFIGFWAAGVPKERWLDYKRELLDAILETPGVENAAATTTVPLVGGSWGHGIHIGETHNSSMFTWVSPGYFDTMRIALHAGRRFTPRDDDKAPRVAVVNETFVRQYLGGANPIGQTLRTDPEPDFPSTVYEIVGVMADTKYDNLRSDTPPMILAPYLQCPVTPPLIQVLIHSESSLPAVTAAVKRRLAEKNSKLVMDFSVFQDEVRDGLLRERLMAMLSGFFGVLAAVLATVGLYGVISFIVARRRNEIGIRMALGAGSGQVLGLVMREAGLLLAIGLSIGLGISLAAGRTASKLLFGLTSYDPPTLAGACILLAIIAALASFLPARRAAKLDPMTALRHE